MGKGDKKTPKRRQTIGLADAIPVFVTAGLLAEPDPDLGGDSFYTKMEYALDAASEGNWSDPSNGVGVNVGYAMAAAGDAIVSVPGLVAEGLAFGARHLVKHSSLRRHTILKTRHYRLAVG